MTGLLNEPCGLTSAFWTFRIKYITTEYWSGISEKAAWGLDVFSHLALRQLQQLTVMLHLSYSTQLWTPDLPGRGLLFDTLKSLGVGAALFRIRSCLHMIWGYYEEIPFPEHLLKCATVILWSWHVAFNAGEWLHPCETRARQSFLFAFNWLKL